MVSSSQMDSGLLTAKTMRQRCVCVGVCDVPRMTARQPASCQLCEPRSVCLPLFPYDNLLRACFSLHPQVKPIHKLMCDAGLSGGGFIYVPSAASSLPQSSPPQLTEPRTQPTPMLSTSPATPTRPSTSTAVSTTAASTTLHTPAATATSTTPAASGGYTLVPDSERISSCGREVAVPWWVLGHVIASGC